MHIFQGYVEGENWDMDACFDDDEENCTDDISFYTI